MSSTMRPIRNTIPVDEALALVLEHCPAVDETERVALRHARGRVAAAAVTSPIDVPPFDRAAMDGYAVRAEDTFGAGRFDPKVVRLVATTFTGEAAARAIGPGECVEIATGAPVAPGADAVVMVEETERAGSDVRVFTPVYP